MRNCIIMDNDNLDYYIGNREWCSKKYAIKMTHKRAKKVIKALCYKFNFPLSCYTIIHLKNK